MSVSKRRGLHAEVVEYLGRRIIDGEEPVGTIIDLQQLTAELDVSLTVIREALKVLAAKGLIDARQKRGTFVCERDRWQLLDSDVLRWQFSDRADRLFFDRLAEVRMIVEPPSARLAAERRTDVDLDTMSLALADMASAGDDSAAAVDADVRFHRAVLIATHNELLQRMEVVIEAGLVARDKLVHGNGTAEGPEPSHRALFEAIRAANGAAAQNAMQDIIRQAQTDLDTAGVPTEP